MAADNPLQGPELVIGLVGAIGADLAVVQAALKKHLKNVSYETIPVPVIELVRRYVAKPAFDDQNVFERYMARMDAGDDFRHALGREDALALLSIAAIRDARWERSGNEQQPVPRCAFILKSLKNPSEIDTLRSVYGKNCVIVSAYSPRKEREKRLATRIAESLLDSDLERHKSHAQRLIYRDDVELGLRHGQNIRETFPLADAFVDVSTPVRADEGVARLVDLLFGHPYATPTRAEHAMFHAQGAALRSAAAGRQVGAAIATTDGDVISLGTNEVAKVLGGQYWGEDGAAKDHRDHTRSSDSTSTMVDSILADLLARARKRGWLDQGKAAVSDEELVKQAHRELLPPQPVSAQDRESLRQRALVQNVIEYLRPVHAEMAAIASAARLGFSVAGTTLYCTAFPCHECAKNIVAAGIIKVVFIEPYPKSRVSEMYDDSISVDEHVADRVSFEAFVGIAPVKYVDVFTAPPRKTEGRWIDWELVKQTQSPRSAQSHLAYLHQETEKMTILNALLKEKGLKPATIREEVKP